MGYQRLSLTRADNGVVLEWHAGRNMEAHREVFVTSGALIQRLDSLHDIFKLDGLNVLNSGTNVPSLAISQIDLAQPEAAASVAVDALLPPGTPELEKGD
jgi:hypothetical protein